MDEPVIVSFDRDEFADLLGIDSDEGIEGVQVAFSPMMQEWSLIVDFYAEEPTYE